MKTILTLLAIAALTFTAQAQTNRSLVYNISNNTVIGPTNTNALTFTNALSFGTNAATTRTNLGLGSSANVVFGDIIAPTGSISNLGVSGFIDFEDEAKGPTRTNLFGSGGISTNIQFVRVGGTTNTLIFSNGLLHSVTTP
jgi:hypothetical protein